MASNQFEMQSGTAGAPHRNNNNIAVNSNNNAHGDDGDDADDPWRPYENFGYAGECAPWILKLQFFLRSVFRAHLVRRVASLATVVFLAAMGGLAYGAAKSWTARKAGSSGSWPDYCYLIAILLMVKWGVQNTAVLSSFEHTLRWHIWAGYCALALSVFHGVHAMKADNNYTISHNLSGRFLSGWIITVALALLYLSSWSWVRRGRFEWFFKLHWLFFIIIGFASMAHSATRTIISFVVFMLLWLLRSFLFESTRKAHLTALPCGVTRITISREAFDFMPGQFAFICVPSLARTEYHPFTISSSPRDRYIDFHVRDLGDWSKQLALTAGKVREIQVRVDGPLGLVELDIEGPKYEYFVCVAGGIGITPFKSIINALLNQHRRGRPLQRIILLWSLREAGLVSAVFEDPVSSRRHGRVADEMSTLLYQNNAQLHNPDSLLNVFIHMTKIAADADVDVEAGQGNNNNNNNTCDPRIAFEIGRPNFSRVLTGISAVARAQNKKVAVLGCGPGSMIEGLDVAARPFGNIDVHYETFEF